MREIEIQELKQIEIQLLKQFDIICKEYNLRYSLGGGTLLGAVRHKGFIPWDDDVDVMMPRADYDSLINLSNQIELPFDLVCYENTEGYNNLFAKISDKNTIIEDESIDLDKYSVGVNIDIFPIDGLGETYEEAIKQFNKTTISREILNAKTWKTFFRSKTHSWYIEPIRFVAFVISRFCSAKKLLLSIDKINREKEFDNEVYSGCVCGVYRTSEIMKTSCFSNFIELDFEGNRFKAIVDYDSYLKKHYGDYMQLPPEEKRITHHTFTAYWKK